ncbi:hypothetical protein EXIGLDRAFT_619554 [Exidia glandulosa HHB12029]|uniref:Uncharacterized protein n=1 Tax=Exidia glandulosa HHB12029 TaxID=1314781 RepID=A0A165F3C0_EXIGL|nr:hypothetical protein EXIGLDRAFT_619554 [Exidia glandulosa HHB12029]
MSFIARTSIARPLFRSALRQAPVAASLLQRRQVASTVSGRPGSQSLPHAAQNIKEEVGNTAGDLARSLGGGALNVGAITGEAGFAGVTGAVASTVPKPVMAFGLAGALPYLGTSLSTLYLARQAGNAAASIVSGVDPSMMLAALDSCLNVQVTYGAVLLSFLGALHWGMEFAGYGGHHGAKRLMLGAAPVLVAWPTLMLEPTTAIVAQWLAFTALWGADHRVTAWGWTPKWYSQYRFYLSILIGTCMIGTLAGNAYFGPVAGHSFATTDLERMRNERHRLRKENAGEIKGDIEALPAQEESDSFVMIRKKPEEDKPEVKKADGGKS